MAFEEPAVRQRTAVVLGATGRLGSFVRAELFRHGFGVMSVGRRQAEGASVAGIDVNEERWWRPSAWTSVFARQNVPLSSVVTVINLIAGRERSSADAAATGVAAIRALVAVRDAARSVGAGPGTVHVGSVAEARPREISRRSPYTAGKRAARAEALRVGVTVILTVGVVPRLPGDPADWFLREAVSLMPLLARVQIGVSQPEEVARAVATIADTIWEDEGRPKGGLQLVLAAQSRPAGEIVGATVRPRWYGGLVFAGLSRLPLGRLYGLDRVAMFARLAGRTDQAIVNHYLRVVPDELAALEHGLAIGGFRVVARVPDEIGTLWLIPITAGLTATT